MISHRSFHTVAQLLSLSFFHLSQIHSSQMDVLYHVNVELYLVPHLSKVPLLQLRKSKLKTFRLPRTNVASSVTYADCMHLHIAYLHF